MHTYNGDCFDVDLYFLLKATLRCRDALPRRKLFSVPKETTLLAKIEVYVKKCKAGLAQGPCIKWPEYDATCGHAGLDSHVLPLHITFRFLKVQYISIGRTAKSECSSPHAHAFTQMYC